ncbi:ABC transporter substrate-binding protein [Leeia sp. TBRC 13508]|uniref:ABC transporter substrate-binding protein n=1 Tax=Leeia speluncae TaxID=2884804 RepID=A0ABS8D494_9NEIS|nr:ABC transporter substrate-binding protein [Leeia speluncae]MCB6183025.1 ABC transporter substrate-binding protein [Leeia speluncae]
MKQNQKVMNISAAILVAFTGHMATADSMVFTSWGGTTQDAQKKAWAEPFAAASGVSVQMDGPTDYGKFKAMVDSGNVAWDVVDVEYDFAFKAAKDGLLEPLDFKVINKNSIDKRFLTSHAVGSFYYSFVLGYNKANFKGTQPTTWADLFDLKKYPGKRTFYKWSAPGVLEIALLADGVPANKLYPLDLDRAFKKLDTIKSQIVWWSGGAQSQQLLASGEAPIGMFWNGRIHALQKSGTSVGVSWDKNLTGADMLVVPKGTKNKAAAMKFLAYATGADAQAKFATETAYAPVNPAAKAKLPADMMKLMPDQYTKSQINMNMNYWSENRDIIAKRWYAWQAQ